MDQETWEKQRAAALAKAKAEGREPWTILAFGKDNPDAIIAAHPQPNPAQAEAEGLAKPLPKDVVERIVAAREDGEGLSAIARQLNADGVPTAHGGAKWHASTIRRVPPRSGSGS